MPEEKNLDRLINICRFGAIRDNVTVLIDRTIPSKHGPRRIPIIEISPTGDFREVDAPPLRVTLRERQIEHAFLARQDDGPVNPTAARAIVFATRLAERADEVMKAWRAEGERIRARQRAKGSVAA